MAKVKILILDSDKILLSNLINILSDVYAVKVVTNGIEGLKAYRLFSPDIILSDVIMPQLNGIDMISELRIHDKNFRAIILTNNDSVEYLLKATELNLTKYLMKPLDEDLLLNAINKAVDELKEFTTISNKYIILPESYLWNYENLELYKNNTQIKLTPKEKKILNYILEFSTNVKTYEDILYEGWEYFENPNKTTLKTIMTNLRKKLPENLIENVYGIGYKINLT